MKTTTQAWGWLAAGVLALGLNGAYHDGGAAWVHQIVNRVVSRSVAVVALATGHADRFSAEARAVMAQDQAESYRWASVVERVQAQVQSRVSRSDNDFAWIDAMSAREEAALARVEASRARVEAQTGGIHFTELTFDPSTPVVCPRVRVSVPRIPKIEIVAPVVHIGMAVSGPV